MADLGYRFLLRLRLAMVVLAFESKCWVASNSGLPRVDESDCGEFEVSESSAVHNALSKYSKSSFQCLHSGWMRDVRRLRANLRSGESKTYEAESRRRYRPRSGLERR